MKVQLNIVLYSDYTDYITNLRFIIEKFEPNSTACRWNTFKIITLDKVLKFILNLVTYY